MRGFITLTHATSYDTYCTDYSFVLLQSNLVQAFKQEKPTSERERERERKRDRERDRDRERESESERERV